MANTTTNENIDIILSIPVSPTPTTLTSVATFCKVRYPDNTYKYEPTIVVANTDVLEGSVTTTVALPLIGVYRIEFITATTPTNFADAASIPVDNAVTSVRKIFSISSITL